MSTFSSAASVFALSLIASQLEAQAGCRADPALEWVGTGTPAATGVPAIVTQGAPVAGSPFALGVSGGRAGAHGVLVAGPALDRVYLPQFGATLYPEGPYRRIAFTLDAAGASPFFGTAVVPEVLCGSGFVAQAVVADGQALGGLAFTPALSVAFGPSSEVLFHGALYGVHGAPAAYGTADLNQDGAQDLVVGSTQCLSILLGTGNGSFEPAQCLTANSGFEDLAIADWNRDGAPDLAVARAFLLPAPTGNLRLLFGNGDGTFGAEQIIPIEGGAGSLASADLNQDGVGDLAVAGPTGKVTVLLGVGDGTFAPGSEFTFSNSSAPVLVVSMELSDLDENGTADLILSQYDPSVEVSATLSTWLGAGDGTFEAGWELRSAGIPEALAVSDLNRDGAPDLIVGHSDVAVFAGLGDGTFAPALDIEMGDSFLQDLAVADWDLDGVPDLAVARAFPGNFAPGDVLLLRGRGDGTFEEGLSFRTASGSALMAVSDWNADGVPDLAVHARRAFFSEDIVVLLGSQDGTLGAPPAYEGGEEPVAVALSDLNADGVPDLVVGNNGSSSTPGDVTVRIGLGDGTFGAPESFGQGLAPASMAAADLDGDGALDLALVNREVEYSFSIGMPQPGGDVAVLAGAGDGRLGAPLTLAAGEGPIGIAAGDLNADGAIDLVVANSESEDVSLLRGTGDGTFAPAVSFGVGQQPAAVALGDLDLDGFLEVITANRVSRDVSVLDGAGDGAFSSTSSFDVGARPDALAVADMNLDGRPDVVVSSSVPDVVVVLLGAGDGTLGAPESQTVGVDPRAVAIADLDLDGVPDVAVTSSTAYDVWVLSGVGDGTFGAIRRYGSGEDPSALAIADLNRDGAPDLAVSNAFTNDVVVLLNQWLE